MALRPEQTDIGVWLTLRTNLDNAVDDAAEKAVKERTEGKGFKSVTNLIFISYHSIFVKNHL